MPLKTIELNDEELWYLLMLLGREYRNDPTDAERVHLAPLWRRLNHLYMQVEEGRGGKGS